MPNTYTQIHIQTVFAVENRMSLINKGWREDLYRYMTAIVQNRGHKVLAIGGVSDHVHLLLGLRPNEALSQLMMFLKRDSTNWINKSRFVRGKFSWQTGFGAFSYSKEQIPRVCNYIMSQEEHHRKRTFQEEYEEMLKEFNIIYDSRYLFHAVS
jgi:REP element-mobilizing transposase RayT